MRADDCNCAPGIDGLVIPNSWAHPEWDEPVVTAPRVTPSAEDAQ